MAKDGRFDDVVGNMYVLLQRSEVEGASKQHCLDDGSHIADPNHQQATEEEFPQIEEDNEDQLVEPLISFKVASSTRITNSLDHHTNSTLVPNDMWGVVS